MASAGTLSPAPSNSGSSSASRDELAKLLEAELEAELESALGGGEGEEPEEEGGAEGDTETLREGDTATPQSGPNPGESTTSTAVQDHKRLRSDGPSRPSTDGIGSTTAGTSTRASPTAGLARPEADTPSKSSSCPPHPGYWMGICIRCGETKGDGAGADEEPQEHTQQHTQAQAQATGRGTAKSAVSLRYIHDSLELSHSGAAEMRAREMEQLQRKRRLCLVLDLDHTLLNSAKQADVSVEDYKYLCAAYRVQGVGPPGQGGAAQAPQPAAGDGASPSGRLDLSGALTLFHLPYMFMWTKLRPGVHKFLERVHERYDLYVYTNGRRMYADAMARLLDPTGRLFGGRVIACSDSTVEMVKDLDVVLGCDSMAVILDDNEMVWRRHRANVVVVERYHFFPSSRREFLPKGETADPGPGLVEAQEDEVEDEEGGALLACMAAMLERVWDAFYTKTDGAVGPTSQRADVRQELRSDRSRILAGCHLVFSRVFPADSSKPEAHPLWLKARNVGATCHLQLSDAVTHVVALDRGTDKAMWALSTGRHLVAPAWVETSSALWRREEESKYPVEGGKGLVGWAPLHQVVPTVKKPERPLAAEVGEALQEKERESGGEKEGGSGEEKESEGGEDKVKDSEKKSSVGKEATETTA